MGAGMGMGMEQPHYHHHHHHYHHHYQQQQQQHHHHYNHHHDHHYYDYLLPGREVLRDLPGRDRVEGLAPQHAHLRGGSGGGCT